MRAPCASVQPQLLAVFVVVPHPNTPNMKPVKKITSATATTVSNVNEICVWAPTPCSRLATRNGLGLGSGPRPRLSAPPPTHAETIRLPHRCSLGLQSVTSALCRLPQRSAFWRRRMANRHRGCRTQALVALGQSRAPQSTPRLQRPNTSRCVASRSLTPTRSPSYVQDRNPSGEGV